MVNTLKALENNPEVLSIEINEREMVVEVNIDTTRPDSIKNDIINAFTEFKSEQEEPEYWIIYIRNWN